MHYEILNVLIQRSINQDQSHQAKYQIKQDYQQQNGIALLKGGNGIDNMLKNHKDGQNGGANPKIVQCAMLHLKRLLEKVEMLKSIVQKRVNLPVIESVKELNETSDVWCFTVPDAECFSLANGAVVHNCADAFRMAAVAYREHQKAKTIEDAKYQMHMTINELIAQSRKKRIGSEG